MDRSERDSWNLKHRCCGACDHWKVWEEDEQYSELRHGDCDKIEAGTEYGISDDGKTVFTFDGYSCEDECYDECLHCFEEREKIMDRIDEIIRMFDKAECPKDWEKCPLHVAGNDCDNYCPFQEAADMLIDYKKLKPEGDQQ